MIKIIPSFSENTTFETESENGILFPIIGSFPMILKFKLTELMVLIRKIRKLVIPPTKQESWWLQVRLLEQFP